MNAQWDVALGARYEIFKSRNGYYTDDGASALNLIRVPREKSDKLSPKFSVGYRPEDGWLLRYSLAKAYRFPIVEELFSQYSAYNSASIANPELEPESGIHHNIMVDKMLANGSVRINLFHETVDQAIESQTDTSNDVRSFVPIDAVEVTGLELILQHSGFLLPALDIRWNTTWLDAQIKSNRSAESGPDFNVDNSIQGNRYPRMPKWRSHLLATYHWNPDWNSSINVQYASDSFGRLDNTDNERQVFGGQDGYTRIGLKTAYQVNDQWNVSVGIDNVTNEEAYVAHPWPGRTLYLNVSFDL